MVDSLDSQIAARCGSAEGAADCLVPVEEPREVPSALRSECRIRQLTYDPVAINVETPDGEPTRKLARGTRTIITANCVAPFDSFVGKSLLEYYTEFDERCFGCQITTVEIPVPTTDPALWSSCTITAISYDQPPIEAGWEYPVLSDDTTVTLTTACGP
jgi:hypothetical protein